MPWTPDDAQAHTSKANTPKLRRLWAHVANSELKSGGDEGRAVRIANGTVSARVRAVKGKKK